LDTSGATEARHLHLLLERLLERFTLGSCTSRLVELHLARSEARRLYIVECVDGRRLVITEGRLRRLATFYGLEV